VHEHAAEHGELHYNDRFGRRQTLKISLP